MGGWFFREVRERGRKEIGEGLNTKGGENKESKYLCTYSTNPREQIPMTPMAKICIINAYDFS